jgi:hypothetical protein
MPKSFFLPKNVIPHSIPHIKGHPLYGGEGS